MTAVIRRSQWRPALQFIGILFLLAGTAAGTAAGADLDGARIPFLANKGQCDEHAAFHADTFCGTVFVERDGSVLYALAAPDGDGAADGWAFRETFCSLNTGGAPRGLDRRCVSVSRFKGGERSRWSAGIPAFDRVALGRIGANVDVVLAARGRNVEKIFTVAPGGRPGDIRVRIEGATGIAVNAAGALEIVTGCGKVAFTPPVAYQETGAGRDDVEVAYTVADGTYGFRVGEYDRSRPLVIDPMLAGTFVGADKKEVPLAMLLDGGGNVYLAGRTGSAAYPTTTGPIHAGSFDAFISLFSPDLTTLIASTLVGGTGGEEISSMILDAGGDIYASGNTDSADFPVTAGAYDETYNGTDTAPYPNPGDIFVVKVSGDLTTLHAGTYCGGSAHEYSRAIALDASGNVVVAGSTGSGDFPATAGAYDPTHNPGGAWNEDGCVACFSGDLSQLVAATYLGGTHDDFVETFVLDSGGAVLVAGWTLSRNYPVVAGSYDTTYAGFTYEAFVSRLSADLSTLEASTFLGGTDWDFAYTMTIDGSDNIYVGGHTASTDYPTTAGAFDETYNGIGGAGVGDDIFVSKMDAGLTTLKASTYLGGSDWEHTTCMTIGGGRLYLTGSTSSADFPMPVNSFDDTYNGGVTLEGDLCAACLDSDLATLEGATYLGGGDREYYETCVACTPACDAVYVAGSTKSIEVPVSPGAFDETHNGGYDGILACFDEFLTHGMPFPVPDVKANGQDGPLAVPASQSVRVTVSLEPGNLAGVKQDWWIFVERNAAIQWWWRYPAKIWTKSSSPIRATGAALRTVTGYAVLDRTLPAGQYVFTFAVDADDMTFEGTYADTVTVDVQ